MDWKKESMQELREYRKRKASLTSIRENIDTIKAEMSGIKSQLGSDGVGGGTSDADSRIVNLIVKKDKLEKTLSIASRNCSMVEDGLALLSDDERLILDEFYINPTGHHVERLCDALHLEKSRIYLRKDQALRSYTIARYGITEVI